jgi:O-antigen/teichoic acid export membrane protein
MFTIATVFNLLEVGFHAGVTKVVAELRGAGRHGDLSGTIGAAVVLMAVLGVVAFAIAVTIALFGADLAPSSERDDFRDGMLVLGVAMLVRFPAAAYGGALIGYQRYDLLNAARAVQIGGFPIGAVVVVEAGGGVLGLAIVFAALLVVEALLYVILLRRLDPKLTMAIHPRHHADRRRLRRFASLTLLADSMVFIGQRMDTVVIAAVRNAATAAPFAAAVKLQSGLQSLTLPFVDLLMPIASELDASGRRDELVRGLEIATRVAVQVTLPVAVALALFSHDVVETWLGSDAPAVTADIVIVLVAVQAVTLTFTPSEKVLVGLGRVRVVAALATVEGVGNLGLSVVLVSAHGAIGAALGTAFTSALLAPLRLPLACRAAGVPTVAVVRAGIVPAIAGSLPGVAVMLGIFLTVAPGAGRMAAGMALGLGLCIGIGLRQVGRDRLARAVQRAMGGA